VGEVLARVATKDARNSQGHLLVSRLKVIKGFPAKPEQRAVFKRLNRSRSWFWVKGGQFAEYCAGAVFGQVPVALKDSAAAVYHYVHAGAWIALGHDNVTGLVVDGFYNRCKSDQLPLWNGRKDRYGLSYKDFRCCEKHK
jgi:hypothetical protein